MAIALAKRGVRARPIFFYAGKSGKLLLRLVQNRGVYTGDAIELEGDEETRVPIITSLDKADSLVPPGTPVTDKARGQLVEKLLDEKGGVKKATLWLSPGVLRRGYLKTSMLILARRCLGGELL